MNFDPQKFFVGLIDFFSILMPGALLVYAGKDWAARRLEASDVGYPLDGAEAVLVFLFASYLLGHFIFLIGSLLDDALYDPLRKQTAWGQVSRLAGGEELSHPRLRRVMGSSLFFGRNADAAVIPAQRLKTRALRPLSADRAVNTFQWSKVRLSREHPDALAAVQRFEADSKFFRSFAVVLLVLVAFYLLRGRALLALLCALAIAPALWRYVNQRFKATQQAYWSIITLEATSPSPPPDQSRRIPSHAGGVVHRKGENGPEFLLVQASDDRTEWVLPKGHIEEGEDPRETAVREVREETGAWARVREWIADVPLGHDGSSIGRFYLMELVEGGTQRPEDREVRWLAPADAVASATFAETKHLLEKAAIACARYGDPESDGTRRAGSKRALHATARANRAPPKK